MRLGFWERRNKNERHTTASPQKCRPDRSDSPSRPSPPPLSCFNLPEIQSDSTGNKNNCSSSNNNDNNNYKAVTTGHTMTADSSRKEEDSATRIAHSEKQESIDAASLPTLVQVITNHVEGSTRRPLLRANLDPSNLSRTTGAKSSSPESKVWRRWYGRKRESN